jgi:ABC-type transporter Mla subunit MlaD
MSFFVLLNLVCIVVSWRVATYFQNRGNQVGYYLNMFASALNGVAVMRHIF